MCSSKFFFTSGEYSMLYLFVRERLQWNVSDYGFFSMYNWLMSAVGKISVTNLSLI